MLRTITLEKLPNSLGTVTQYSHIFYKFVGALIKQFNLFEKYHAVLPSPTLHHVDTETVNHVDTRENNFVFGVGVGLDMSD